MTSDSLFLKLLMFLQEIQEITPAKLSIGMESQVFLAKYKLRVGRTLSLILSYQKASKLEQTPSTTLKKECGRERIFPMRRWKAEHLSLLLSHMM